MVADEDSTMFYYQLVRKRTRAALETIINQIAKPGMHVKSDEHKAHYWLGKTTKKRTYQLCRPVLHKHTTVCHKRSLKQQTGNTQIK